MTVKSATPGRSRAARAARGRALVTVTLSAEAQELLAARADLLGVSRSAVVEQAIREMYARRRDG